MNTYAINSEVDLDFTFRNKSGALADPVAATFYVQRGDGTEVQYHLSDTTRLGVGSYELTLIATVAGRWYYRGEGTAGLIAASLDQSFLVETSRFVP
jgi:hypothetical protein